MASQEFLASFGVEIDEGGVTRLQNALSENRDLANEVAAAFQAATAAIREYEKAAASGDNPSGEGNRNDGTGSPSGNTGSAESTRDTGSPGNSDAGVPGAKKDGFWISDNRMQNLARLQLGGVLTGDDAPAMPSTARELTLANLETMYLGQASRDSNNARKELISWKDIGLSSNPTSIDAYDEMITAAQDLLREPMEKAREYMKQAMDAEDAGQDGSEYVQMVDDVLRKPLEQVKEMVDSFDFGDESGAGGKAGGDEGTESEMELDTAAAEEVLEEFREKASEPVSVSLDVEGGSGDSESPLELDTAAAEEALEAFRKKASEPVSVEVDASGSLGEGNDQSGKLNMDLTEAKANLESFRKDASKPVSMSGNASGMVSAARSAYNQIKSIFSTPVTMTVKVKKEETGDGNGDGSGNDSGGVKMSVGGRFTKPTDVQVAEDGDAEYIIPVKKENRAVPLLKQLLSELSPQARASLVPAEEAEDAASETGLQIPAGNQPVPQVRQAFSAQSAALPLSSAAGAKGQAGAGDASGLLAKLGDVLSASLHETTSTVTRNTNQNVSAPVTIQVHSSSANAEQVGQKLYDTTERYLLRTLKNVMA